MELVLYAPVISNSPMLKEVPKPKILQMASPAKPWQENRIFFAPVDGHTRLVDFTQTMYDVDVTVDDGGSEFDSIASPAKFGLPLDPISDDTESTSSFDEAEYGADTEDLAEFHQFDCAFVTCVREKNDSEVLPIAMWSFSDDEGVIDPGLLFLMPKQLASVITTANTSLDVLDAPDLCETRGKQLQKDESSLSVATTIELKGTDPSKHAMYHTFRHIPSSLNVELFPDAPAELQEFDGCDAHWSEVDESEETLVNTEIVSPTDATYVVFPDRSSRVSEGCAEEMTDSASREPFRSDWASELNRMTLGTESLFTFLDHLPTDNEEFATESGLVTAFLNLVNLEREKLGEHSLPRSYTASSIMASKIIPHTIFLGTTSLASFISHFTSGTNSKTTTEEVCRVFMLLCKEDLHLQIKATSGIMGALGQRLGRLPTI
jgi:hypothetical protein